MTTDRKTGGLLSIFRRLDAGNVPEPWVPPELPASPPAPVSSKRVRTQSPPAPWVPAELPSSTPLPTAAKPDRKTKLAPWVPPAAPMPREAPRKLSAAPAGDDANGSLQAAPAAAGQSPAATLAQNPGPAGQTNINVIVQQYTPWWGWGWGGCPRLHCPQRAGRPCRRWLCW